MIPRLVQPTVASLITSRWTRDARRALAEMTRRARRRPHQADVYLRLDDPYSLLLAQVLPDIAARFAVRIRPHVVAQLDPSPPGGAESST